MPRTYWLATATINPADRERERETEREREIRIRVDLNDYVMLYAL